MNIHIEIQRYNVTLSEFFRYVKKQCEKKGLYFEIDKADFENPPSECGSSYTVVDGIKKCHYSETRTTTNYRRKHASYTTPQGFTRYYYTDELEEYQETKRHSWSREESGEDAPCKAEIYRTFPLDFQTYMLAFDGSCYNECCEFHYDDDKKGYGYYYQANKDANN